MRQLARYHKCEDELAEALNEMEENGINEDQWDELNEMIESLKNIRNTHKKIDTEYDLVDSFANFKEDSSDEDEENENLLDTKMEFLNDEIDFGKLMEDPQFGRLFNNISTDNIFQKENKNLTLREWLAIVMMDQIGNEHSKLRDKFPHIFQFNNYNRKENTRREMNDVRRNLDVKNKFSKMTEHCMRKLMNVLPLPAIDELENIVPELVFNAKTQNDVLGGKKSLVNFNGILNPFGDVMNDVVTEYLENVPLKLIKQLQDNDNEKDSKL